LWRHGGSKSVPRKNIAVLGKHPLIAYKIIAAQKCKFEKRIIVSTDDAEIAEVAKSYGADVPFVRPVELAGDFASSVDVVDHAMKWITENEGDNYDYVCLMEPSSPFLSYRDIDRAFDIFAASDADTLLGMKKAEISSRFIHSLDKNGGLSLFYESVRDISSVRRQDQEEEYTMNGCIYAAKWKYFVKHHSFHSMHSVPYIMQPEQSVEIDSQLDLILARGIVENRLIDLSLWD